MRPPKFSRRRFVSGMLALLIIAVSQGIARADDARSTMIKPQAGETVGMKTIGLLGGMSWESSIIYYRLINEDVKAKLGGLHSAKSVMYSVDFAESIEPYMAVGDWATLEENLVEAARHAEAGGADFILICTNTMHKAAGAVEKEVKIPLLHIADATAEQVKAAGLNKVGLLGTRITMEDDFYKGRLIDKYGLEVIVPTEEERKDIHRIIFDELFLGNIKPESKARYREIMDHLVQRGAQAIILGCTEIGMLIGPDDSSVPLFDTAKIHAAAAVTYALEGVDATAESETSQ